MANNHKKNSPSEGYGDEARPKGPNEGITRSYSASSYRREDTNDRSPGESKMYSERKRPAAGLRDGSRVKDRLDGGNMVADEYVRGRTSGWDRRRYDEDRWDAKPRPYDRWSTSKRHVDGGGNVFPRRLGHHNRRTDDRREYPERRFRREEFHGVSSTVDRRENVDEYVRDDTMPVSSNRSGERPFGRSSTCGFRSMSGEAPRCSMHTPSQRTDGIMRGTESMLMNDLMGVIVVDTPGSGIVPILLFFEKELSSGRCNGMQSEICSSDVHEHDLYDTSLHPVIDEHVGSEEGVGNSEADRELETRDEALISEDANNVGLEMRDVPEDLGDKRYRYFLRRTLPTVFKSPELSIKYIIDQRSMLLERAKNNRAEIPELCSVPVRAPKNVLAEIPKLRERKWSEEEENRFKTCIPKFGNDFKRLMEHMPNVDMGACILGYYLMKNKTFSYIKRRPGRMSDSEIKLIVENEWSSYETNVFAQHFRMFGKNWAEYQNIINKTEKDLKIFFRYYTKFIASSKKKTASRPRKASMSKSEMLKKWTIDERQIFAIYFPYYNRNWISMATYFPSKTSGDLRQYYNKYYKALSYNEQRLEASLYDFGGRFSTPPVLHVGNPRDETVFCSAAGVLFKR